MEQPKNNRQSTTYNKVVNYDGKEILMLNDVFKYSDDFKGATGTSFEAVSKAQYKECTSKSNVIDFLDGCFTDEELFSEWGNGLINDTRDKCLGRLYKAIKQAGEVDQTIFDLSYMEHWDYLRDELKLTDKDAYIFTCTGGGRCFDKNFKGNINTELSAIIREYES